MLRNWIIQHLPEHRIFVDLFGGGGNIVLAKHPAKIDVYNDLDSEIFNVFQVARENSEELKQALTYMPYSREAYVKARGYGKSSLQRALNTIVKSYMGDRRFHPQ